MLARNMITKYPHDSEIPGNKVEDLKLNSRSRQAVFSKSKPTSMNKAKSGCHCLVENHRNLGYEEATGRW
jgi:hypothetical protein